MQNKNKKTAMVNYNKVIICLESLIVISALFFSTSIIWGWLPPHFVHYIILLAIVILINNKLRPILHIFDSKETESFFLKDKRFRYIATGLIIWTLLLFIFGFPAFHSIIEEFSLKHSSSVKTLITFFESSPFFIYLIALVNLFVCSGLVSFYLSKIRINYKTVNHILLRRLIGHKNYIRELRAEELYSGLMWKIALFFRIVSVGFPIMLTVHLISFSVIAILLSEKLVVIFIFSSLLYDFYLYLNSSRKKPSSSHEIANTIEDCETVFLPGKFIELGVGGVIKLMYIVLMFLTSTIVISLSHYTENTMFSLLLGTYMIIVWGSIFRRFSDSWKSLIAQKEKLAQKKHYLPLFSDFFYPAIFFIIVYVGMPLNKWVNEIGELWLTYKILLFMTSFAVIVSLLQIIILSTNSTKVNILDNKKQYQFESLFLFLKNYYNPKLNVDLNFRVPLFFVSTINPLANLKYGFSFIELVIMDIGMLSLYFYEDVLKNFWSKGIKGHIISFCILGMTPILVANYFLFKLDMPSNYLAMLDIVLFLLTVLLFYTINTEKVLINQKKGG